MRAQVLAEAKAQALRVAALTGAEEIVNKLLCGRLPTLVVGAGFSFLSRPTQAIVHAQVLPLPPLVVGAGASFLSRPPQALVSSCVVEMGNADPGIVLCRQYTKSQIPGACVSVSFPSLQSSRLERRPSSRAMTERSRAS